MTYGLRIRITNARMHDRTSNSSKVTCAFFLVVIAVAVYFLNATVPMIHDDYHLSFKWHDVERIGNWVDVVDSWVARRSGLNARLSDVTVSIVMMLGGKSLFNVLNSIVFIVFLSLTCAYAFEKIGLNQILLCLLTLIFLPHVDATVFWISGACNYLWPSIFYIAILIAIRETRDCTISIYKRLLICIGCLLCGMFHEGLGVPLFVGLLAHYIYFKLKGRNVSRCVWLFLFFIFIGLLPLLTAPTLHARVSAGNNQLVGIIFGLETFIKNSWIPLLTLTIMGIKKVPIFNSELGWITFAFCGLSIVAGWKGDWGGGYYYFCLSSMLLFLENYGDVITSKLKNYHTFLFFVFIVLFYLLQYFHLEKIGDIVADAIESPKKHNAYIADCSDYGIKVPWILEGAFPLSPTDEKFPHMGLYHGQENFYVLLQTHKRDVKVYDRFNECSISLPVVAEYNNETVIRLPKGCLPPKSIQVDGLERNILMCPRPVPLLSNIKNITTNREIRFYTLDFYNGCCYVFLPIPPSNQLQATFDVAVMKRTNQDKIACETKKYSIRLSAVSEKCKFAG